jgi:hypothetical protein
MQRVRSSVYVAVWVCGMHMVSVSGCLCIRTHTQEGSEQ